MTKHDLLREWAAAERSAIQAEELLRSAVVNHLRNGSPAPSLDTQTNTAELRTHADKLFGRIMEIERDYQPVAR